MLDIPHFLFLEENNVRQGFLEDGQYEKLVEGAELWFRTLVECGSTIGWRHQELVTLRVKQVDLEHRTIRLEPGTTKNKEGREAPMTDTMLQLLPHASRTRLPKIMFSPGQMASRYVIFGIAGQRLAVTPASVPCTAGNAMSRLPTRNLQSALGAAAGCG